MSSDFSALNIPELTVAPDTLFESGDPQTVSVLLNEFELSEPHPYFSGLIPDNRDIKDKKPLFKELACHLLKAYETYLLKPYETDKPWKHADQRRVIEKVIRLLDKAEEADNDILPNKAKAYLYRSRIIRPKGFTVPAKKKQALEEALKFSIKAGAHHLTGVIALEMDRCDMPPENFKDILEKAVKGIDPSQFKEDEQKAEFYRMRLRLAELEEDDRTPDCYEDDSIKNIFKSKQMELEKLKVAIQSASVSNKKNKIKKSEEKVQERLKKYPFSHPLWEDTVRFVRRLYQKNKEGWQNLSLNLWEIAEGISARTSSLHLRWYWSRQRDLYDLAFLSALEQAHQAHLEKDEAREQDRLKYAAKIADSAKNRPALTWQAMEQMGNEYENIKKEIEQYAQALGGGYISGFENISPERMAEKGLIPEKLETDAVAVQFYLVHLKSLKCPEKNGYALIYDGKTKQWSCENFNFHPIWEKYVQWQTVYFELPEGQRHESAGQLKELCSVLGEELAFLFESKNAEKECQSADNSSEQNRNMIFIPHDFLHRVPVHGAINKDETAILLKNFNCTYLPVLGYASFKPKSPIRNEAHLIEYFSQDDKDYSKVFDEIENLFDQKNRAATSQDLLNVADSPPKMLTIYCHGQADVTNPFYSKLLLKDNLELIKLAGLQKTYPGSHIFLGACETDLMPPLNSPVDEQLSMAAMFLQKGASSVLGTLWEANRDTVKEVVENMLSSYKEKGFDGLFDVLEEHDEDEFLIEPIALYYYLCFKLYNSCLIQFKDKNNS